MPTDRHIEHFYLKFEGENAPAEVMNAIIEVEVDFRLNLPTMFSLILQNPGGQWTDDTRFQEGKVVEISAEGEDGPVPLCKGKVTVIEPELTGGHQNLTLRGYDLSYGLYRNRHRRSYVQMTDSDIVRKIAQDVGLQTEVESTSQVHEYIFQNNQTYMEFLRERSRMIGFELFVREDRLVFRSPPSSPDGSPISLEWGVDFTEFRPRLSIAEQVEEVTVKGWNPAQKSEIIGRATRGEGAPAVGERRAGGSVASGVWGRAAVQISDRPVASQAQADRIAQAILNEQASKFITAQGNCRGNPQIKVGKTLDISGVGNRFSGRYYVTSCNHRLTGDSGYITTFSLSTRSPKSMLETIRGPSPERRNYGVFIGIVTNNRDPQEMGRVKVKFPWLEDGEESNWARIASPAAGDNRGTYWLPEVNDEVLVGFEHGSINHPYILGCLWNGEDKPPLSINEIVSGDGRVQKFVWKSRSGHTIIIDDSDSGAGISICDKTGKNTIVFDSMRNSLKISAAGDISIEAQGKVTIKGTAGIDIEGSPGQVNVKGTTVNIN